MEVIAVSIAKPKTIDWRGRKVSTGIFKKPVDHAITLGTEDVDNDHVVDRRFHGGIDKACYIYSFDHYSFWKTQYPELAWDYGMFGENMTIAGVQENQVQIGDIYSIGTATVQVSQPRQPCFKLGVRFGDQGILKTFIQKSYPGFYVRVLQTGEVKKGDQMIRLKTQAHGVTVVNIFDLLYHQEPDQTLLKKALALPELAESAKAGLMGKIR